jgi:hypothetical protein
MELSLCAAYAALFVYLIRRSAFFRDPEIPTGWLQVAFLLKVIAGSVLGFVYYHHYRDSYTSDTIKFFNDSRLLFDTLHEHPFDFFRMLTGIDGNAAELRPYYERMSAWLNRDVLFNDNKTIIRLNAFFHFFSMGHYYVHVVLINMLSFTGLYALYRALSVLTAGRRRLYFVVLFLLPSLLFWGSGLLKDGFMLFALGMAVFAFSRITSNGAERRTVSLFIGGLFILLFTKFYVIMTVLPGFTAWYLSRKTGGAKALGMFSAVYALSLVIGFNLYRVRPEYDLAELIYWKQHNFLAQADRLNPASRFPIPELEHGAGSILMNAPAACLRSLLHPMVTDRPENPMVVAAGLENLLLLCFLLLLTIKCFGSKYRVQATDLFSLFFCISILTLTGLITPVLGAMVRYKIVIFPFLLYLWVRLLDPQKTGRLFPFIADRTIK